MELEQEKLSFGSFIMAKRQEMQLTLVELADKSGISHPYLSQLESGKKSRPSPGLIKKLADALDIPLNQLELLAEFESSKQPVETLRQQITKTTYKLNNLCKLIDEISSDVNDNLPLEASEQLPEQIHSINQSMKRLSGRMESLISEMKGLRENISPPQVPAHILDLVRETKGLGHDELSLIKDLLASIRIYAGKPSKG